MEKRTCDNFLTGWYVTVSLATYRCSANEHNVNNCGDLKGREDDGLKKFDVESRDDHISHSLLQFDVAKLDTSRRI